MATTAARAASLLLAVVLVGCTGTLADGGGSTASPPPDAVRLHVSNQSFDDPTVAMTLRVDGDVVVDQRFDVEDQHNWVEFHLSLPAGDHELDARADSGVREAFAFETREGEPLWLVLDHWWYRDAVEEDAFTLTVSDEPVGFD